MDSLTAAWIAEAILITYRGSRQTSVTPRAIDRLAMPSEYAATFVIYGALSLVPEGPGARVAGLFGWGVVVATLLNLWDPTTVGKSTAGPSVKQTAPGTIGKVTV